MLVDEVVEIIELTDSDHLSQAMDLYNEHGFVEAQYLPFMDVVFDTAPEQLAKKLSQIGFRGQVQFEKCDGESNYIIFDAERTQVESTTLLNKSA